MCSLVTITTSSYSSGPQIATAVKASVQSGGVKVGPRDVIRLRYQIRLQIVESGTMAMWWDL